MSININIKFNLFKPREEKNKNYEPSAPPEYSDFYLLNDKNILPRRSSYEQYK